MLGRNPCNTVYGSMLIMVVLPNEEAKRSRQGSQPGARCEVVNEHLCCALRPGGLRQRPSAELVLKSLRRWDRGLEKLLEAHEMSSVGFIG